MQRLTPTKHRVSDPRQCLVKPPDDARRHALTRLYARRSAVNNLIGAVERYQLEQGRQRAKGATAIDGEMSS